VDIENTSQEGLQDLLSLSESGSAETFIYHNEYAVTFHPKLYLFTGKQSARLIIGSNNLTEAGLFSNTEAGLQVDAGVDDALIVEARTALASWRDPSEGLAKKLDLIFLNDLITEGYVLSEANLRRRRQQSMAASHGLRHGGRRRKLFKSKSITVPPILRVAAAAPLATGAAMVGRVLLMRVRRASETERRTQVQFPIRLVTTQFFENVGEIRSSHDNRTHGLVQASARGKRNTIKVEIPEIEALADPVLRLERTATGIIYQAFDSGSVLGRPIMDSLRRGLLQIPPTTLLTVPTNPNSSTWYRFI